MLKTLKSRNLSSGNRLKEMFGEDQFDENEQELVDDDVEIEDDNDLDDDSDDSQIDDDETNEESDDELDLESEDELEVEDDEEDTDDEDDDDADEENTPDVVTGKQTKNNGSNSDDWDEEEDDFLVLKFSKHKARLKKGKYAAKIGKLSAEKKKNENGENWINITIPFEVKDGSEKITVPFRASRSLSPKGRLYPIVEGILGSEPQEGFDLRKLEGKRVRVEIDHYVDKRGSVWDEVIGVEKAS